MQKLHEDAQGVKETFHELYEEHGQRLRIAMSRYVRRDQLDDVCQEAWRRAIAKYATQFDGNNFRAWLFTIAQNVIKSGWRAKPVTHLPHPDALPVGHAAKGPAQAAIDEEERKILASCISNLGQPRRAVFEGRFGGAAYEELAATLGLTREQAFKHFFVAKQQVTMCCQAKSRGRQP